VVGRAMKIGIIGQGFVGTAIREGLKNFYPVLVYDIKQHLCPEGFMESPSVIIQECEIIFQCLPTPMKKTGECDLDIVKKSLKNLNALSSIHSKSPIVVVKSTVPPGTCEKLNQQYKNINIVFSPEFLTEANSIEDFKNQTRIVLGGPRPYTTKIKSMFRKAFPQIPIIKTGYETAEMVKYFINNFLSTKVIFANEMYEICNKLDIDYDKVTEYASLDQRIGRSHLAVPGPDGDFGYGGHCFPKDLNAIIFICMKNNIDCTILRTIREKNDKIRKNRDWENMSGRAISYEE
jgi:UDPglucose 6-dehydrogenase